MSHRFKVWCPVCQERAYLGDREAAETLAQNHDDNHHDGARQAFVLSTSTADQRRWADT